LSEELLSALEPLQLNYMGDDCVLSLHALSGAPQHKAIQFRALVKNQALVILVDSGSSHTFLNSDIASKLKVVAHPVMPMRVKVANGASIPCVSEVIDFEWWIQGLTFKVNAKVIEMGAYDLVLGMDWLEKF
jgi:predicted aspartyl protease